MNGQTRTCTRPHINLLIYLRTRGFRRNTNYHSERVSAAARVTQQPRRLHYVTASRISTQRYVACCEIFFSSLANLSPSNRKQNRWLKQSRTLINWHWLWTILRFSSSIFICISIYFPWLYFTRLLERMGLTTCLLACLNISPASDNLKSLTHTRKSACQHAQ